MSRADFEDKAAWYQQKVWSAGYLTLAQLVGEVLHPLVHIGPVYDPLWKNRRISGTILEHASYAGCRLGDEASIGDLEFQIWVLEQRYDWGRKDFSPSQVLTDYFCGKPHALRLFFNELLSQGITQLQQLQSKNKKIWYLDPERPLPRMDLDVVNTDYHLYMSLLRLIDVTPGNASDSVH
jgi:hypothetical protein